MCHAHGGRAGQVRWAADQRREMARVWALVERTKAQWQAERDAVAPWAESLRREYVVSALTPRESARRYRTMASEMNRVARLLRAAARELDEEARGRRNP